MQRLVTDAKTAVLVASRRSAAQDVQTPAGMTLAARLAIAMILLVALAVFAVGWFSNRRLEQVVPPRVLDRIETHAKLAAAELETYVAGVSGDVGSYHSAPGVIGLIRARRSGGVDPADGTPEKIWRERIASRFLAVLEAKPSYAEFRFIGSDNDQREIIRVDRLGPGGSPRVAPDSELQPMGDRDFVRETIRLQPGETYVSPLNLDDDNGTIRKPYVPKIHVTTPVYFTREAKPFGMLAIDIDMRPVFNRVRSSLQPDERTYLVNARGDYLVHPDMSREFGSQLGVAGNWRDDFPSFASALGVSVAHIVPDENGQPGGAALAPALLAGKELLGVIVTVPNAVLLAPVHAVRDTTIMVGLVAMLCAAGLAVIVARSLTRPIKQLTAAVEGVVRNDWVAIPVDAEGETGILARAFARVMGEVRAKTAELEREVQQHYLTEAARDHFAERERLYSAAVESSNDAIMTQSLDGTITGWNPAAEQMFGYLAEEAVGQNIDLIVPAGRSDDIQDILGKISRGERIQHEETVRGHKDGSLVEVLVSISPIKNPAGQIVGISKIARDITQRRRTEQALRQQTEERRRIFETSQDLILITDSQGLLIQVSPSAEAILGYLPDEMVGRNAAEFVDPEDLEHARAEMRAARNGRQARNTDTRYIHRNGRAVTLTWMASWSEPVQRHFFVGRDMTESRLARETLHESEQLARNIIETALDAFVQTDEGGRILNWNSRAEKIFGWPREEILGKDLPNLIFVGDDRQEIKAALERFLQSGNSEIPETRREIVVRRRNGREFRAEMSVTALKTRNGFLFNGFFRDLTNQIAAEERIRQAEKMEAIGQLTGGIAHDFNNILTVITGTIEILASAVANEPKLAAITKMIDEAAARGADLTQHLLAFARRQPLQPREIDINTLIVDIAKLLRPTLGEQIEIEALFEDEACLASVDPNHLTTAILNLALNSRDAMPDGGKLILETGWTCLDENYARMHDDVHPGRYALIAVSDTGNGIPASIIDRVFDPFFTSKGVGKGTGLGLSMVYGFVKQSAGHIAIYSEEGHGTTIKMYLPPGNGVTMAPETAISTAIEGGEETILVVEDDRLVRDHALAQLRSLGYATLEAANAAEALVILDANDPIDLLFTDMIMPGAMNGRQLACETRRRWPSIKVLFTSGYTENTVIHHGRLDSGVLLLAKPYRKSEMARMIRTALDGSQGNGQPRNA
jgi:PAS domain S-box-containing protein